MHKEIHTDKHGHRVVKYVSNEDFHEAKKPPKSNKHTIPIKAVPYFTFDNHTLTQKELKEGVSPYLSLTENEIKHIYNANPTVEERTLAHEYLTRLISRIFGNAKYIRKDNVLYASENHLSIVRDDTKMSPFGLKVVSKSLPNHRYSDEQQGAILNKFMAKAIDLIYGGIEKPVKEVNIINQTLKSIPPRRDKIKFDSHGIPEFIPSLDKDGNELLDEDGKEKKNNKGSRKDFTKIDKKNPQNRTILGYLCGVLHFVAKEVILHKGDRMGYHKDGTFQEDISLDDLDFGDKNRNQPFTSSVEDTFFNDEQIQQARDHEEKVREWVKEQSDEIDKIQAQSPIREVGEAIIDGKRISPDMKRRNKFIWNMFLDNYEKYGTPKHTEITEALIQNGFKSVSKDTSRQVVKNISSQIEQSKWKKFLPGMGDLEPQKREEDEIDFQDIQKETNQKKIIPDPIALSVSSKDAIPILSPDYRQELEESGKPLPVIIPAKTLPSFNKQAYASLKSKHLDLESKNDNSPESYKDRGNVRVMYSANDVKNARHHYITFYKRFANQDGDTTKIFVYTKKIVEKLPKEKKKGTVSKKKGTASKKKGTVAKKKADSKKKGSVNKGILWRGFVSRMRQK